MHELSITQGIVDICLEHSAGRRVGSVTLQIGELAGVVPEAVEFCFAAVTAGTLLEGARLIIELIPAKGHCLDCHAFFGRSTYFDPCPICGGYRVDIQAGEELRVKELDVEEK